MREVSHSTPAIFPAYWLIPVSCLAPIPPFVPDNLFSHHSPGTSSQQDFSFDMQYNRQAVVGQESKVFQKKFPICLAQLGGLALSYVSMPWDFVHEKSDR